MADQETNKPALQGKLQEQITGFSKGSLTAVKTDEKSLLPDAETIEAEKKAAKEEAEAAGK